jgi:hypothetical protein
LRFCGGDSDAEASAQSSARSNPQRERELAALCDPEARAAIEGEGIVLRSFAGIGDSEAVDAG